jgi:hypothetical protein
MECFALTIKGVIPFFADVFSNNDCISRANVEMNFGKEYFHLFVALLEGHLML